MRRSALHAEHVRLGADMGRYAWAGMAMPWDYGAPLADEQRAVRERAGLVDTSQLQVVSVRGPGAVACLERLVPRRIEDMAPGISRYSVVLSRFGRIYDEALILRLDRDHFWISHGCGGTQKQLAKLGGEVEVEPLSDLHVLAVQGPSSAELLAPLVDGPLGLPLLAHRPATLAGHPVRLSRTGFTGELGFEVFCAATDVGSLWAALLDQGLLPYGYRCVDLLRVQAGFLLHPTDLSLAGSIWEAGFGWLIRGKQAEFIGHEAVARARGAARHRFVGVRRPGERAVARGCPVLRSGQPVGVVTSAAYSPASDETLCIARVDRAESGVGSVSLGSVLGGLTELPFRARRTG